MWKAVWSEVAEVVWLTSMVAGISLVGVMVAIALVAVPGA